MLNRTQFSSPTFNIVLFSFSFKDSPVLHKTHTRTRTHMHTYKTTPILSLPSTHAHTQEHKPSGCREAEVHLSSEPCLSSAVARQCNNKWFTRWSSRLCKCLCKLSLVLEQSFSRNTTTWDKITWHSIHCIPKVRSVNIQYLSAGNSCSWRYTVIRVYIVWQKYFYFTILQTPKNFVSVQHLVSLCGVLIQEEEEQMLKMLAVIQLNWIKK